MKNVYTLLSNCKIIAQLGIFFLLVKNMGKCVELTKCKLDRFLIIRDQKSNLELKKQSSSELNPFNFHNARS